MKIQTLSVLFLVCVGCEPGYLRTNEPFYADDRSDGGAGTHRSDGEPATNRVPAAPVGVQAIPKTSSITIKWNAVASATSYSVYWANTAGVIPSSAKRLDAQSGPYLHVGLNSALTYYYVVLARNAAGASPRSAEVSARPGQPADTSPPVFAGPGQATAKSSSQVGLSWVQATDNVTPANSIAYDIYVSQASSITFSDPPTTSVTGITSYVAGGLKPETTYSFAIRARDAAGNRDKNNVVRQATTQAEVPPGPYGSTPGLAATNFDITDCNGTAFSLHAQYKKYPGVVLLMNTTKFT